MKELFAMSQIFHIFFRVDIKATATWQRFLCHRKNIEQKRTQTKATNTGNVFLSDAVIVPPEWN
jgi:hypothetical protein